MKSQSRNGAYDLDKSTIDYEAIQAPGHGHSVAGWIPAGMVMLAAVAGTIGFVAGPFMLVWVGVALVVLAIILAPILHKAGLGPKKHHNTLAK